MDRLTFLQSLPFLYNLPESIEIPVWKQHRSRILQHCITLSKANTDEKNDEVENERKLSLNKLHSSVQCLFPNPNFVVSIEPKIHHDESKGKPAFFLRNDPSSSHGDFDPSLVGFSAYLLPAEINTKEQMNDSSQTNGEQLPSPPKQKRVKRQKVSPAISSTSTTLSTPRGNSVGGKFENDDDQGDDESRTTFKTHLLYFVFTKDTKGGSAGSKDPNEESFDLYFVDHQSIESIEIEGTPNENDDYEGEKADSSSLTPGASNPMKQRIISQKPPSLLVNFQSCSFRIFGKDFLLPLNNYEKKKHLWNDQNYISEYAHDLRERFETIKSCILEHRESIVQFHHYQLSFFSYIMMMNDGFLGKQDEESNSNHENAQIEKVPTTDEDTTSKSNSSNLESNSKGSTGMETKDPAVVSSTMIIRESKRKRRSYRKSWNALENIHEVLRSRSNMNGLEHNQKFRSLLKTCATGLSDSFMVDHIAAENMSSDLFSRERELECIELNLSGIQNSMDDKIRKLFPSSTREGRPKSTKISEEETCKAQDELEKQLKEYRKNIIAKHTMTCMPLR